MHTVHIVSLKIVVMSANLFVFLAHTDCVSSTVLFSIPYWLVQVLFFCTYPEWFDNRLFWRVLLYCQRNWIHCASKCYGSWWVSLTIPIALNAGFELLTIYIFFSWVVVMFLAASNPALHNRRHAQWLEVKLCYISAATVLVPTVCHLDSVQLKLLFNQLTETCTVDTDLYIVI